MCVCVCVKSNRVEQNKQLPFISQIGAIKKKNKRESEQSPVHELCLPIWISNENIKKNNDNNTRWH